MIRHSNLLVAMLLTLVAAPLWAAEAPSIPAASPKVQPHAGNPHDPPTTAEAARSGLSLVGDEICLDTPILSFDKSPELRDVDLHSEEGRAKVGQVVQAGLIPQVRAEVKSDLAKERAKIRMLLDIPLSDFAAIEPIMEKVQILVWEQKMVRLLISESGDAQSAKLRKTKEGMAIPYEVVIRAVLSDPAAKALLESNSRMLALMADPQSPQADIAEAIRSIHQARADLQAAIQKADVSLKSVLTKRQEARMIDLGILR